MRFSELSLAERDTKLTFDSETLTLYGEKRGYGVTVTDRGGEYIIKIFADAPYKAEDKLIPEVNRLAEALPKNAVTSQRCEAGFAEVRLDRDLFLQEKLPLLFEFSDALIGAMSELGVVGAPPLLPKAPAPEKAARRLRAADFASVKGLLGAVFGAAAMIFISSALIRFREGSNFAAIGSYILSAASTVLIFFDYRFLAKKLDPFGVLACPVLSAACSVLSAMLITARSFAESQGGSAVEAFFKLGAVGETLPALAAFGTGLVITGTFISAAVSVVCCMWYFGKHSDEMFRKDENVNEQKPE